jgi:hypothetical protein
LVHPVWSATTCDYPGAGVYIGLAPRREHVLIGRILSPKRLRVVAGGCVRFGTDGGQSSIEYYAVRDPSVVRVIPVDRPPLPNGFRHVKLSFKFDRTKTVDDLAREVNQVPELEADASAAFLMTIGLRIGREDWFYERAIGRHADQEFTDLYARLRELGCQVDDGQGEGR